MGALKAIPALILGLWVAVLASPAEAQGSGQFLFRVCNNSGVTAAVAISPHVSTSDSRFRVVGWYVAEPGCTNIGSYPKGWFYFFAEQRNSGRIYWGNNDIQLCVEHPGPFDRVNVAGYTCDSSDLKGFSSEFIDAGTGTYTWTLN